MPNCDFYAVEEDFELLLDFVFERSQCRVFESYSPFGESLAEFVSILEINARHPIGVCRGAAPSVLLELLPRNAGELIVERVELNPAKCNGSTFRHQASGWGLIQLQLGGVSPKGIIHSHTNHNSEKRALTWESVCLGELGPVSDWNWREVERTSRKINAFIRKQAVDRKGSRPIMPAAAALLGHGLESML